MENHLKKYTWQFFWYYLLGYVVGIVIILALDIFAKANIHDIILMGLLSFTILSYICNKFLLNEKRYLNKEEEKRLANYSTWIGFLIVSVYYIIYYGYAVFIRMSTPADKMQWLMIHAHINPNSFSGFLLTTHSQYLLLIIVGTFIFYYGTQWYLIHTAFKRARKKHEGLRGSVETV